MIIFFAKKKDYFFCNANQEENLLMFGDANLAITERDCEQFQRLVPLKLGTLYVIQFFIDTDHQSKF